MLKKLLALALGAALPLFAAVPALAAGAGSPGALAVPGQTWDYLDQNPPGDFSIIAYSLGGRPIRQEAQDALDAALERGAASGFSAVELERGILSLVKLGQNPQNYQKQNLLAALYTHGDLHRDGLGGACLALMAYEAAGEVIPESARNAVPGVIDYIISSQQRAGGFAFTTGREADVLATAQAVAALAPSRDINYVNAAVEKAIDWLSAQQNANGTFSAQKKPSCEATAGVLTALRSCGLPLNDPRFVKNHSDLLDALDLFENTDGGYASHLGEPSSTAATELAVIARITDAVGMPPYLAPSAYPGYEEPPEEEPDTVVLYLVFFAKLIGILALLYVIVIITPKLAKMIDKKRKKPLSSGDTGTFEIHIPMKAQVPDLDEVLKDERAAKAPPQDAPQTHEDAP